MSSIFHSTVIVLSLAQVACNSGTKISGVVATKELASANAEPTSKPAEKYESTPGSENSQLPEDSEAVAPPTAITGTLLRCISVESNVKIEVQVGCRYENSEKKRLPLSSIAKEQDFTYSGNIPSNIIVSILPARAEYEVFYSFPGSNFAALNEVVKTVQFSVRLKGMVNGQADQTLQGPGAEIVSPPAARWIRQASSDTNSNGVCDNGEACVYVGNGIMWIRDGGTARTQTDAVNTCKALYNGWDMPTGNQFDMALAKGILDISGPDKLNIGKLLYWTAPDVAAGNTLGSFSMNTGGHFQETAAALLRSICIHPAQ